MPDPRYLHEDLQPGAYWACDFPEREPQPNTQWSKDCRACIVHEMACLANGNHSSAVQVKYKAEAGDGPQSLVRCGDLMAFLLGEIDGDALSPAAVAMQKRSDAFDGDADRAARALGVASARAD